MVTALATSTKLGYIEPG